MEALRPSDSMRTRIARQFAAEDAALRDAATLSRGEWGRISHFAADLTIADTGDQTLPTLQPGGRTHNRSGLRIAGNRIAALQYVHGREKPESTQDGLQGCTPGGNRDRYSGAKPPSQFLQL